jgi:hypothetical protein
MQYIRSRLRTIVLAILVIVICLLLARFILVLLNVGPSNLLVIIISIITAPFALPFEGVSINNINIGPLVAIMFIIFLAYLASKIIGIVFRTKKDEQILELVETIFRVIEALLFARLILKIFGIEPSALFVSLLYGLTSWSSGMMPSFQIPFWKGEVEISTLITLIIFLIIDFGTESGLRLIRMSKDPSPQTGAQTITQKTQISPQPAVTPESLEAIKSMAEFKPAQPQPSAPQPPISLQPPQSPQAQQVAPVQALPPVPQAPTPPQEPSPTAGQTITINVLPQQNPTQPPTIEVSR